MSSYACEKVIKFKSVVTIIGPAKYYMIKSAVMAG